MRYDLKLLKDGLEDVIKTREGLVANQFPASNWVEIEKVDAIAAQLKSAIKKLEE